MLLKKELKTIPFCRSSKKIISKNKYYANAKIFHLEKSKEVLVLDIYNRGKCILRFFSNRKSYVFFMPKDERWSHRIGCFYCCNNLIINEKATLMIVKFLSVQNENSIYRIIWKFIYSKTHKEQEKKYKLKNLHFSMVPKLPTDLREYCNQHIFPEHYIFISNIIKKFRNAECSFCGHQFMVSSHIKNNMTGVCPQCNSTAVYKNNRSQKAIKNKLKLCIPYNANDNLIIIGIKAIRMFRNNKLEFYFEDNYIWFSSTENGIRNQYIYLYRYILALRGRLWFRLKAESYNEDEFKEIHFYRPALSNFFENTYYIQVFEKINVPINLMTYVDKMNNLSELPQLKKYINMNLCNIAFQLNEEVLRKTVHKHYLELCYEMDLSVDEYKFILYSSKWISKQQINKMKVLEIKNLQKFESCLKICAIEKFLNYITVQKSLYHGFTSDDLINFYLKYVSVNKFLKVNLSNKSLKLPSKLIDDLNVAIERKELLTNEDENKIFAEILNNSKFIFSNEQYKIMVPESRQDFIREGQALKICVGNSTYKYIERHLESDIMIFFVRKKNDITKPYFTMEVDMINFEIKQIQGFCHKTPPAAIVEFTESYINHLKSLYLDLVV